VITPYLVGVMTPNVSIGLQKICKNIFRLPP